MIGSINKAIELKDYETLSTLSLKCALFYLQEAKKSEGKARERLLDNAQTFKELYEKCSYRTVDIHEVSPLITKVEHIEKNILKSDVMEQHVDFNEEIVDKIDIIQPQNPVSVRPYYLVDYIGQGKVVERIKMLVESAKQRNDAIDHILLYGSAGLGKTSLAQVISHEMNAHFIELNATTLNDPQSFATILKSLEFKDILFIDEVHALSSTISDMLLTVLEDYRISYIEGKTSNAKVVNATINKFTFIGATTHPGLLSKPLLDRMIHKIKMERYTNDELALMIQKSCFKWGIIIHDDAALEIAKRSRSVPRIANNFVLIFRDVAQIKTIKELTVEDVSNYFSEQEIDEEGITNEDRRLLKTIIDRFQGGPVSLMSLASVIGDNENIIEYQIEPYLIQKGFLTITKSGRVCTDLGHNYINDYFNKGEDHEFK